MRLREESDAIATSLRLAGISMPEYMLPDQTEPVEDGEAFGAAIEPGFLTDLEDDLIADDLRRFDRHARILRIAGSASVVTDRDVRLTVINVNRKKLEHVHGVDLVYYDHINDQATAVQYKRLERTEAKRDGRARTDWVFRRKAELVKQLSLMQQQPRPAATSTADWRLSPSPDHSSSSYAQRTSTRMATHFSEGCICHLTMSLWASRTAHSILGSEGDFRSGTTMLAT